MNTADTIASVHESSARSDAAYALCVDSPFIVSEAGESARKWRPAPGELVSLWDMLRFNAGAFVSLMGALKDFEFQFARAEQELAQKVKESGLTWEGVQPSLSQSSEEAEGPIKALQEQYEKALTFFHDNLTLLLNVVEAACSKIELSAATVYISYARSQSDSIRQFGEYKDIYRTLRELIERQLEEREFFFLPSDKSKYFMDEAPFGEMVRNRFPKLTEDISEASKCLGVGRYTAAVFHLMRIMEGGVRRLAKKMSATINLDRAWGPILKDITDEIARMPTTDGREVARKDKFHEVAAYLNHVRGAWRNSTMHPKRTYTAEDAIHLFNNVRSFIQTLARLR